MNIQWPVFLVDKDGYMYICRDQAWFEGQVEQIDAEEGEYKGWDHMGQRVVVSWNTTTRKPILQLFADTQEINALREAVVQYAKQLNPTAEFQPTTDDPTILFELAEAHGRKNRFTKKLKRFFRKVLLKRDAS